MLASPYALGRLPDVRRDIGVGDFQTGFESFTEKETHARQKLKKTLVKCALSGDKCADHTVHMTVLVLENMEQDREQPRQRAPRQMNEVHVHTDTAIRITGRLFFSNFRKIRMHIARDEGVVPLP